MVEEEIRIERLEKRLGRFNILAGPDIDVAGSIGQGYAVNLRRRAGGNVPPPTGACCVGADCSILSEADCATAGGIYQGNGFPCAPNPCVMPTGACCIDTACSILTEADCNTAGGIYQGDDTTCDPDPCAIGACCDGSYCVETDETTCTDAGRIFQGVGTTCADPDICPTGACCNNFSCTIDSQFNCESFGGTYQGDSSLCDPDPCPTACCPGEGAGCTEVIPGDCTGTSIAGTGCEGVVCGCTDPSACNYDPSATNDDGSCVYVPGVTVVCDISFNNGSKCGFFVDGTPPKYYLEQVRIDVWTAAGGQGGGQFCHGDPDARIDFNGSGSTTDVTTTDIDADTCAVTSEVCSASGTLSVARVQSGSHASNCDDLYPGCSSYSFTPGCPDGSWALVGGGAHITTGSACGFFTVLGPSSSFSYANEFTTAMLIAKVEAGLPPFPGTFEEGGCASSRFLSTDEVTYSEQTCQYKIVIPDTAVPVTITWNEHFDGGGDTPMSATLPAHTTETSVYFLAAPSSNGTITITDVMVSCA